MMQEDNQLSNPSSQDYQKIKQLIESNFMHDWAIRIEYAERSGQDSVKWLTWDKTFFAIKDVEPVLEDIIECCKNHPECSMKLVCEHFSPDCRFVCCVRSAWA